MRKRPFSILLLLPLLFGLISCAKAQTITTGAEQMDKYLSLLEGKRVGILANPTSIVGDRHLVDTLIQRGIQIKKAFGPEHGFRGNASAGIKVGDEIDEATGIKIISLYGKKENLQKKT